VPVCKYLGKSAAQTVDMILTSSAVCV